MKICLLNDSFPPVIDGVVNAVVNYAEYLSKNNEVLVGTPGYPGEDYSKYPYQVVAYPSADTAALTGGYRAGYPFAVKQLGMMKEFQPDIIHTHCPMSSMIMARSLREVTDAPVILTYHTKYDIDIRRSIHSHALQEGSIKALVHHISAADEVWAVSHGAGENLKSLGYEGNYKVVVNGVDFPKGRMPDEEVKRVTGKYDLPSDVPVFLFVGRIVNYKGLPLIAEALAQLKEEEDFRMVFIGSGVDEKSIKDKVRKLSITMDETLSDGTVVSHPGSGKGKVIFTGSIPDRNDLRSWNTRADLFLFPSVFDTNGLVVREAAACGLASILIRNSCAAEGITDGLNGYLCEENADSLYQMLKYACSHLDEIHQAGEHAMDEIYISWSDAVSHAYGLYEDLLERKRSGKLTARRRLSDDPVFEKTAETILRYSDFMENEMPVYEGMLDNLENRQQQLQSAISEKVADTRKQLEDLLAHLK